MLLKGNAACRLVPRNRTNNSDDGNGRGSLLLFHGQQMTLCSIRPSLLLHVGANGPNYIKWHVYVPVCITCTLYCLFLVGITVD